MKMRKLEEESIVVEGKIAETFKGGLFKVVTKNNIEIFAKVCGKMRQNMIKVIVGDMVKVEVCPYEMSKGRIISRPR